MTTLFSSRRACCAILLHRVEPHCEDDGVGIGDRVLHGGGACERSQFRRERVRPRFVLRGQDDGLAAAYEVAGERAADVADADDCGCQLDSFPICGHRRHPGLAGPVIASAKSLVRELTAVRG
jgi:hypothetical protein